MSLVFGAICPHPPILIPKIGQENLGKVQKTIQALLDLEKKLVTTKPDVILIISPHGPVALDKFNILGQENLAGNFSQFGDQQTEMSFRNDLELVRSIQKEAQNINLPLEMVRISSLDHGMLVPLFYLTSGRLDNLPIVGMGFCHLPYNIHFKFGKLIQNVVQKTKKRIAFIASGDLSHRLTADAPAGYSPMGQKFDNQLIKLLKENKAEEILKIDPSLVDQAGECGLRSIIVLLGALDGLSYKPEILSYEGPFGVGYLVANFKINSKIQETNHK
jgi:MEMO1 family protein